MLPKINSYLFNTNVYFQNQPTSSALWNKKIWVIASIAFVCLAAAYFSLKYVFKANSTPSIKKSDESKDLEIKSISETILGKKSDSKNLSKSKLSSTEFAARFDQFMKCFQQKEKDLDKKFTEILPQKTYSKKEARYVIERVKGEIQSEDFTKQFANSISESLLDEMIDAITNEPSILPEESRVCIVYHYCLRRNLDARYTFDMLDDTLINKKDIRFKFVKHLVERDSADLCEEIDLFELDLNQLQEIAEKALYYDGDAFFENLNEFRFNQDDVREEYYLRGLMRSIDPASKLLDDSYFIDRLRDFSPNALKNIYRKFKFGQSEMNHYLDQLTQERFKLICERLGLNQIPMEDIEKKEKLSEELFSLFIQKPYYEQVKITDKDRPIAFYRLPLEEQLPLLAMILFLNDFENPENFINQGEISSLLREIATFNDPNVRFAIVALTLKFKRNHENLEEILKPESDTHPYKNFKAITLHAIRKFCPDTPIDEKKWRGEKFDWMKSLIIFVAELHYCQSIPNSEKKVILEFALKNRKTDKDEYFLNYAICLKRGLNKKLLAGEEPTKILSTLLKDSLDALGKPYGIQLSTEKLSKLKHQDDIGYYAQGLEQLPSDEKDRVIPFFFRFLRLTAKGKMQDERYNTPELQSIFQNYSLETWKSGSNQSVEELFSLYPGFINLPEDKLNIKDRLKKSFEEEHINKTDYPEFYDAAFGTSNKPFPLLNGKIFGETNKKTDDKSIKQIISHLLSQIVSENNPREQHRRLKQLLIKIRTRLPDFKIDIESLITEISQKTSKNKDTDQNKYDTHKFYRVIRSDDPYILFRIGSIAGKTCQRVTGDPTRTKCLLSYPSDGKNQAIYLEDQNQKIYQRAIIRFFKACKKDDTSDVKKMLFPVLYLEPLYPKSSNEIQKIALKLAAIDSAKKLGVYLVRHRTEEPGPEEPLFPYLLGTINGPGPFEYFDGLEEGMKIKENDNPKKNMRSFGWIDGSKVKVMYDPKNPDKFYL